MTFEECHATLTAIRKEQGTPRPLVRVDYGGTTFRGRLTRSDSDVQNRRDGGSPYGVLVLTGMGLTTAPETILQIANIPPDGLRPLE
ncbi:hypothetical protein [Singulisphaera sp. PoT]|uniref:hypothetical protein n=1 Tax=Singulisphaera sp. PoT TaxID=3411797 RepID=UPI003BF4BEEA